MKIHQELHELIDYLEKHGYETWLVGGCVRDHLLGLETQDFDLATKATPDELQRLFSGLSINTAGLKHGSLGIAYGDSYYEITTFRADGKYSDHRRPDQIFFSESIDEDLKRRDFTVNAIAWHPERGYHDPFLGMKDIEDRCLRCVGDPFQRFTEDPLRILRGLRFLSKYDFEAEANSAETMIDNRDMLFLIAKERIYQELKALILGRNVYPVLRQYKLILDAVVPELQNIQSYWEQTIRRVHYLPQDPALRLAALFCDVARYRQPQNLAEASDELSRKILRELRAENQIILEVTQLIRYHLSPIKAEEYDLRSWLNKLGEDLFKKLIALQMADALATDNEEAAKRLEQASFLLKVVLQGKIAYSLRNLAIDGDDLIEHGFKPGLSIGLILERLLDEVMKETLENEKTALIDRAYQLK